MSISKKISFIILIILLTCSVVSADKKFKDFDQDTTPATTDVLLKSADGSGTTWMYFEHLFDLEDVIGPKSFEDSDWGDMSVSSNAVTIDDDVLDKANFKDEDWGDMSVSSNSVTIDEDVLDKANFKDEDWGDLSVSSNTVSIDTDAVKDEHIDWTDVTSSDITFDADSVATTAVYSGTTSLEETTAADDSGAYIIGVYGEFDNSVSTNVQDVLDDLDAAITAAGGGDITAVGPGFATGGAFTDGVVSTGTTLLIWEGTTADTYELNIIGPEDPTADINITLPSATGTLLTTAGDGESLTNLNGENIQNDTVDDDSIDFTDVTLADFTFDVGNVSQTEFGYLNNVTSNIQTQLDAKQTLDSTLTDIADGTIAENLVNTDNPWADNEVVDALTVTAQAGSTWDVADSVTNTSVYSGTTSLDETTAADDSGAYIIGVYDEFTNSDSTNIQDVLDDLDAAIVPGGGDISAVGPGFAVGEAFTDGTVSTGTTMFVWEGTTDDTNELSIISPSADPGSDIDITLPSSTGTLAKTSDTTYTASTSVITPLLDAAGAEDMDYGSADVTDHTFTTEDCTVIIDGGVTVTGASGAEGILGIYADAAEDNADKYRLVVNDSGNFDIESYATSSWNDVLSITSGGNLDIEGTFTFATSLNIAGVSLDETELDILDGATLSTTQLNYLNAATGTTGTTSTSVVFSTSPTLTTPTFSGSVTLGAGGETMDNATDDYVEFQGVSGDDDTDLRIDLDGTHPVIDSPTDSDIEIAENLITTGTITVGTSTVTLSSSGQVLTMAGTGGTYNENLKVDLDTPTDNVVGVSSTEATHIQPSIGIGSLTPVTDSTADFAANFTGANLYGGTFVANADDGDLQLPLMAVGMNFCIIAGGTLEIVAATNANDGYLLDGVDTAEDNSVVSTGTAGDIACFQYYTADDWLITTNGWSTE